MTSPSRVRALLQRHGLAPDRAFGQNYLVDSNALDAVVAAAAIGSDDTVVEFGPGLGTLTAELLQRAARVVAVELDARLLPVLNETLPDLTRLELLNEDALDFDYSRLPPASLLVANLPYNVATPLVMNALESGLISRIVVMVQREVAQRMSAAPGEPGFGAYSLLIGYYADARIVRNVAPGCFYPPPEVTSSIVRLDVRSGVQPDPELFALIHDAFRHRRKTLRKNLLMAGWQGNTVRTALTALQWESGLRAEELTLLEFRQLQEQLLKND